MLTNGPCAKTGCKWKCAILPCNAVFSPIPSSQISKTERFLWPITYPYQSISKSISPQISLLLACTNVYYTIIYIKIVNFTMFCPTITYQWHCWWVVLGAWYPQHHNEMLNSLLAGVVSCLSLSLKVLALHLALVCMSCPASSAVSLPALGNDFENSSMP